MTKLTVRQKDVLQAIMDFTEKNKYPPSVRELCEIIGLKSSSTMHRHLEGLKLKGLVTWEPYTPRTIKILEQDKSA